FFYGQKEAYLKNLYLKTPQTVLKNKVIVKYKSLANISKNPGNLIVEADLNHSKIAFQDILLVVPQLENTNPFKSNPTAILYINTNLSGKLKDLNIPYFEMQGIGNTKVSVSGKISGLPNMQKVFFDLDIKNLESTSKDVISFVPTGTIPKNIQLPSKFNVNGKFKGSMVNFQTKLALKSSYGAAKTDVYFDRRIKNKERYDAEVSFSDFDLGKLITNDSIGKITGNAKVKGNGLDPKTANVQLEGIVHRATYNKYTYKNLTLKGKIEKGLFDLKSGMNDPNLNFKMVANGEFKDKYPTVKLNLDLDIADLEKLNLHAGPMKLRGNVDADIANSNPDYLNGNVFLSNIQFLIDKEPIVLDSIKIIAFSDNKKNNIKITSQFLKAELDGKYKLTTLSGSLKKSLSKYIDLQTPTDKLNTDEQRFTFHLTVENEPVLFQIIPKLTGLEPIAISAKYNNVADTLQVNGSIPRLIYAGNTISGANFKAEAKEKALEYHIAIATVENGEFKLPYTTLSGKVENNIVDYALQINDNARKEKYYLAGQLEHKKEENIFKIDPEKLILNYESWAVNPQNSIEFGANGLYINQFELSKSGDQLKIQSQQNQKNAPIDLQFSNFKIETILGMVEKEDLQMQGLINGSATIENLATQPIFTSDLKVDNFVFHGEEVGNISLKVDNTLANTLTADMQLSGEDNKVDISGKYTISNGNLDFDADINHLNIKSIQGFSMGNITDGSGSVTGEFKVTGNVDAPKVNGELNFNDAAFRVTKLNSYLKIADEKIHFDNEGITLDHFTVQDEKNNELKVDGKLLTENFRDFNFDLIITADNFRAVHSKEKDNDKFYGDLFLDTKLNVKGTLDSPIVNGNIKINEDTKFNVVMPQSDPSIEEREGIVEFVDEDNMYLKQTVELQNELNQSEVRSMDINVTIVIDKEAELTLVIDKANGDYLNLKGEAELTGGIDPSGKTNLTGKYELSEGTYEMNFNMIKRKFEIQKGSYIIWNGEPTMANINITAIYKTDAAPIDLLGNQLATASSTVKNTFKQKIPFETLLKMNGELLKPTISFDITIPKGNYDVSPDVINTTETKLEQLRQEPSELNKQVFALLLLNRFVGENPFASEAGGTSAEAMARQSVSQILSQQLNDIAGGMVGGFQLEFDLESTEDYTSGTKDNRTDLDVGLSKKLLNDRLKMTIGSSFGLEGQERANEDTSNIAGDVSLEYELTKDGRYVLRAYRKNEYQVAIQGEIVETGAAFVITMEYDKFKELFHRTVEEKEIIEKEKLRKEKKAAEKQKNNTSK
ncbi:MAG: translocation/assembly module TamB domain-containing protein, partial [Flavobacterium sp.]